MLQKAIVTAVHDDGTAEVVVERAALCGGDCSKCEACMYENTIKTRAKNTIKAHPGQQVVVETDTGKVFGAMVAIYLLPLVFFFAGYGLGILFSLTQGMDILFSFVLLGIGILVSHFLLKAKQKKSPMPVEIVSFKLD